MVFGTNLGYGGGNNVALEQSIQKTKYSLLLNTDASIEEAEVEKLIVTMKSDQNIFSTGPLIEECSRTSCRLYYGGRDISSHLNTRMEVQDLRSNANNPNWIKVDYTIGTILLVDNRKLQTVGLFDEDYFFSGEVADLCYRATQAGYYSTTSLKALGKHTLGDMRKRSTMYKYYNLRNRGLYIFKHKQGLKKQCRWVIYIAKDAIYFAIKGRSKEAKSSFLALLHTMFHLYGNRNNQFV